MPSMQVVLLQKLRPIPSNATTAYMILSNISRMQPGDTVLIHAAAGGVGSSLGQVARALGAGRIIETVGSTDKFEFARNRENRPLSWPSASPLTTAFHLHSVLVSLL
ncbi:hypothetical protein HUB94_18085 [Paenibacillus cellulosilyticus]|nr:hypothetical protein HUB94_18085 [Paenibacillus cellulosilyticus]